MPSSWFLAALMSCTSFPGKGKLVLFGGPRAFWVFCALRGLSVHIDDPKDNVRIDFW